MCFVLVGCWPCGHMKPIRTRFCDQAEKLHTEMSSLVSPTSPLSHGSSCATAAFSTGRTAVPLPSPQQQQHHHHHHHAPPSAAAGRLVGGGVSSNSAGTDTDTGQVTASFAPCPKGVNQYDHAPNKACPMCGREPKDVPCLLGSVGQRQQQQQQQQQFQSPPSPSCSSSVAAASKLGCAGVMSGGGCNAVSDGMSIAMRATLTDEELAVQFFGDLEGMAGGMATQQQLLTPPTEVMGVGSVGGVFGAFGGDASETELFGWCV